MIPDRVQKEATERRRLELQEWSASDLFLNASELEQLLRHAHKVVRLQPLRDGRVQVQPVGVVGRLRLDTLDLIIRPKTPVPTLLQILSEAHDLAEFLPKLAGYGTADDFVDLVAALFLLQVDRLVRQGLRRSYVEREAVLQTVRGRIDLRKTLELHARARPDAWCQFEEFTLDGPENRLLLAALRVVAAQQALPAERRVLARRLTRDFPGVQAPAQASALRAPTRRTTRLNRHYEPALGLAELILASKGLAHQFGLVPAAGFLLDMARLFERFVAKRLRALLALHGVRTFEQDRHPLDEAEAYVVKPDLVLQQDSSGKRLVVDTKYKTGDHASREDLYQMIAYCRALSVPRGVLIQVGRGESSSIAVRDQATEIEVLHIDLSGTPRQVSEQLAQVAVCLVDLLKAETRPTKKLETSRRWSEIEPRLPGHLKKDFVYRLLDRLFEVPSLGVAEVADLTGLPTRKLSGLVAQLAPVLNLDGEQVLRYERPTQRVILDLVLFEQVFDVQLSGT